VGRLGTKDIATTGDEVPRSVTRAPLASWRHDLRTGVTEYSGELLSWLGFQVAERPSLDQLLAKIPEHDRGIVEDLVRARNPDFRSLSHALESNHGRRLVQHHIGFDAENQQVTGAFA
jgi:hypothetical protein